MTFKLSSAVALIILSTFISCAGTDKNDYIDTSLITPESEKRAAEQTVAIENNSTVPNTSVIPRINNAAPGIQTYPVNTIPQNNNVQVTPVASTATGKINPAHGQPGHRCDIAVGAPLDSKPATVQPASISTQPGATTTEIPNQQKTRPGMNPPHGEPGHRCDIAVGAPLNSKPASANVNANATPITIGTQPTQQKTLPGMNPPHGEPNHRCDIAVGAPLNSKPAAPTAIPAQSTTPPALLTPPKADSSKN